MLKTFDDIFTFFKEVCSMKNMRVICGIWINRGELTSSLRQKVQDLLKTDKNIVSINNTSNHIFISFKTGCALEILPINNNCRGKRFFLSAYDNDIDIELINTIIKPCTFKYFSLVVFSMKDTKCNHCICKTCAIAEINGGAPGCGNCKDCDLTDGCRSCNKYYNPEPIRNE